MKLGKFKFYPDGTHRRWWATWTRLRIEWWPRPSYDFHWRVTALVIQWFPYPRVYLLKGNGDQK